MPPKKNSQKDCNKRIKITLELKREIIENRERGMSVAALTRRYNRSSSTICTILKNKDKIKQREASKGVTRISVHRLQVLDDVEKLLLVWINEKQSKGHVVNENNICKKAKMIFADLVGKRPSALTPGKDFKASRGWFEKFKRRTGIHRGDRHGEGMIHAIEAAKSFVDEFKQCLEDYLPQQVFSCNQTGLFWKKMPKTYITAEANALPDHEASEDRLKLLLCANASGDLKIKPLLVYHSENPRAFRKCSVQKNKLNVMWRSNSKVKVTRDLLTEWVNKVFGPSVKKYLLEMNVPLQALLIMDGALVHPPGPQEDLLQEFKFVKLRFLPPNTSALLQPMDQQVISSFKKLYTKALFERCFEVTESSNLTVREFWKDHFHIVTSLRLIEKAWEGITKRTLVSGWRRLWPQIDVEFDSTMEPEVDEILSLAKTMGMKVNDCDIEELVEERDEELTTEELMEIYRVSQQKVAKERSALEEEEGRAKQQSSSSIREMLSAWGSVASFIEKHHPDKAVALKAISLFSENAVSPFQLILKRRQKHMTSRLPNKKN